MLKKTTDFADFNDLLLASFFNLSEAARFAKSAQNIEQTLSEREVAINQAKGELGCLRAHFEAALDLLPLEVEDGSR